LYCRRALPDLGKSSHQAGAADDHHADLQPVGTAAGDGERAREPVRGTSYHLRGEQAAAVGLLEAERLAELGVLGPLRLKLGDLAAQIRIPCAQPNVLALPPAGLTPYPRAAACLAEQIGGDDGHRPPRPL